MIFKHLGYKTTLAIVTVSLAACSAKAPEDAFIHRALHDYILPLHGNMAERSKHFDEVVSTQCSHSASELDMAALQEAWRLNMRAWQQLQAINYGPINEQNLAWKFQFWPDSKNLVAKKTRPLLAENADLSVEKFAKSSTVVQGLSAVEYLLFDFKLASKSPSKEALCGLLSMQASQLKVNSSKLLQEWQGSYGKQLSNYGPENVSFPDAKTAVAYIIDGQLALLETASNKKLADALGSKRKNARVNPYLLESWRSQNSRKNLLANLASVDLLWHRAGMKSYLESQGAKGLADKIEAELLATQELLRADSRSFFSALTAGDKDNASAVNQSLKSLTKLYKHEIPAALEIQLGFNNNDGD